MFLMSISGPSNLLKIWPWYQANPDELAYLSSDVGWIPVGFFQYLCNTQYSSNHQPLMI